MAQSKANDKLIKFRCSACKRFNYYSRKNSKKDPRKLELSKYCKWCKKHTKHKETKR